MGLLQRDAGVDLVVLARDRERARTGRAASGAASPAQSGKEVGQIDVVEGELPAAVFLLPVGRRAEVLPRLVGAAQAVVGGALLGVFQGLVGFPDFLEFLLGIGLLGDVGVILAGELAVRLLDVVGARRAPDAERAVIVLVFNTPGKDSGWR
jgi:hypothetical protein